MSTDAMSPANRLARIFARNRKLMKLSQDELASLAKVDSTEGITWVESSGTQGVNPGQEHLMQIAGVLSPSFGAEFLTCVEGFIKDVCTSHQQSTVRVTNPLTHAERRLPYRERM